MEISEQLFEKWCSQNDWSFVRIPKAESKRTPDYRILISSTTLYAEVKEIVANQEEKRVIEQLNERGWSEGYGGEPGKTVREKIKDSYEQIKGFAKPENCSGFLVLYNNSGMMGGGRVSSYDILTGMFGLQTVSVAIPNDPKDPPIFGNDYLGPKKSVTPNHCRYLSGIMTIEEDYEQGLRSSFYHNPYATYPVNPTLLRVVNSYQYKLSPVGSDWDLILVGDVEK